MSIQHHFKLIVTQTVFLADLIEITIGLSVLFVIIMFWINTQIINNNETLIELMKANITLTGLDLQTTIQSINFLFNITKIAPIIQQQTTLITIQGIMSNLYQYEITKIQLLSELYIPNIPYYIIDIDNENIYAQNNTFISKNFIISQNCENNPNYCNIMNQYKNYFQFMKAQTKEQELFYTLFPSNIQLTQICGLVISKNIYQCFVLDLNDYKQPYDVLYGTFFTINNSIISDVVDNCLYNDFRCNSNIQLQQFEQSQQNTNEIIDFLNDFNKTDWYNQLNSITTSSESSNPINSLTIIDMKVHFYQSLKIGTKNNDDEYQNEYKEDLLNQTKEEYEKLQSLQQNYYRWQLLATFNNDLYDSLIQSKQEDYFEFYLFFQFVILLLILTPILQKNITQSEFNQISVTLQQVTGMMENFLESDFQNNHSKLKDFKQEFNITLLELIELLDVYYEFCWLTHFLEQLNKKGQDLDNLKEGLEIFKKRNSIECLELILLKLIAEHSRQKKYEEAIKYNKELVEILEQQKQQIQMIKSEEIMRINYKLFQSLNQLLDLLSKDLISKKGKDRNAWNEAKNLFSSIMDFADTLEIKFTLQIKLLFKKCKLLFNLRKIKEAEQCIDQAQLILQQNYTQSKQSSYQNKSFNQDKKLFQVVQQKIYFYRGLIYMSSSQLQPAIQQLMLALDYGNVYQQKLRVKTIKMISQLISRNDKFRDESQILTQIQYFFQNEKRYFNFLIDSTQRMSENQNEIVHTIKHIIQIMNDDDLIKVSTFDDQTHILFQMQSKISMLEMLSGKQKKNEVLYELYDMLSGYQSSNHRKLYNAILDAFKEEVETEYTCYLIVMTFGENYTEQNEQLNVLLDKLRDGYWHFILCSTQEKKYINQRNNFYRLTDEARDGTYIDLFANFEEGLSKMVSLCC